MTNAVVISKTKARERVRDREESIEGEREVGEIERLTDRKTDRWRARKRGELIVTPQV